MTMPSKKQNGPKSTSVFRKLNAATTLRLLFALLLIAWLFVKVPFRDLAPVIRESLLHWPWWIAALLFTFTGLTAGSIRWWIILRSQGFLLTWPTVFRLFFIGQFFNSFFLGGCGGDLIRAYYAAHLASQEKAKAASTVLVDRSIGLLTILVFGCLMIFMQRHLFIDSPVLKCSAFLMFAFLIGAITTLALSLRKNIFDTIPFFKRIQNNQIGSLLKKAYEVFFFYRERPAILALCILLSLANLCLLTLACICFAQSLLINIPVIDYFTLFPVITILTAIPLTPGGLGVRENLFAEMFMVIGVATFRTIPLSLLVYFGGLCWSLFGGLLYLMQSSATRNQQRRRTNLKNHFRLND